MGKIVRNNFDISPLNVVQIDGEGNYNVEQINNEDGTCILNISDAESSIKWKEQCKGLWDGSATELTVPDGITLIKPNRCEDFRNLKKVEFPDGLIEIGSSTFQRTSLEQVKLPDTLIYLRSNAFDLIDTLELVSESLPQNLIYIGEYCFRNAFRLKLSILPNKLNFIGRYAFYNCPLITIKELPEGIKEVNEGTFKDCVGLTQMTFLGNITRFERTSFQGCINLTKFSFPNNTVVPTLGHINAIPNGANFTGTIEVPSALLDTWKASTNWVQLTQANWVGI